MAVTHRCLKRILEAVLHSCKASYIALMATFVHKKLY